MLLLIVISDISIYMCISVSDSFLISSSLSSRPPADLDGILLNAPDISMCMYKSHLYPLGTFSAQDLEQLPRFHSLFILHLTTCRP